MKIGIIVYEEDVERATQKATDILTELCDHCHDALLCMKADSKKGQEFIKDRMATQERSFKNNLTSLRKHLENYTNDELWNQRYADAAVDCIEMHHRAWQVGQYAGSSIYLYDDDGEGIQEPTHPKNVLEKWPCLNVSEYDDLTVYVVSAIAN